MKKADSDEMRPEYDFSSGVRGKYLPRLAKGANVVVLDRDLATRKCRTWIQCLLETGARRVARLI